MVKEKFIGEQTAAASTLRAMAAARQPESTAWAQA